MMELIIPKNMDAELLAYLGIGVLTAIKHQTLRPEMGIWTLALPKLIKIINDHPLISPFLLDCYRNGDELDLLFSLNPSDFDLLISDLLEQLHNVLKVSPDPSWMQWTFRSS
ncbi:hypothetical protein [Herpetosiphon giganteus]|uniref:hypothetical protein n=1 Tax=Herpetosiphon giganteus TaxID=2029754 RepID=UPI001956DCD3|nr:hypothetical protein [Herpetosiphon giganteus]MBM7845663.1 hypothetical protein [Herpetosiphon giganteus]